MGDIGSTDRSLTVLGARIIVDRPWLSVAVKAVTIGVVSILAAMALIGTATRANPLLMNPRAGDVADPERRSTPISRSSPLLRK
jgi:hypothetical protein